MTNKKYLYWLVAIVLIVTITFFVATNISRRGKIKVDLIVAPSKAEVLIDGKYVKSKTVYLKPGEHTFVVSFENFESTKVVQDVSVNPEVLLAAVPKTDSAREYLLKNPEENSILEKIGGIYQENANKKGDSFWNTFRPVPLTEEESTDYIKKDILQTKKKSKVYLDSIDAKHNKFKVMDVLKGYGYNNSFKKWSLNYEGPLKSISFNTVQGYRINAGLSYTKRDEDKRTFTRISSRFDYGFSEEKIRATANYIHKFNNTNNSLLTLNGGSSANQFNGNNPISNIVNSISTLFFKNNFMKLYEKNFVSGSFGRELVNGIYMNFGAEYAERKPLYNTTDYTVIKSDDLYTSNNPLSPNDETSAAISKHNLVKTNIAMRFNFGQKYLSRPDGKYNIPNDNYPSLSLGYEKTFAATNKNYEYDFVAARVNYDVTLGNKGILQMAFKGGKFFNADNISFVDYRHFNGNQTHIGKSDSYTNEFNLLPYYVGSTNKSYSETHIEHNDKGYFMNKIPLLKLLRSQLVLGFHNLAVPDRKPYQEFSVGLDNLGFGKYRLFRLDYVRSYQNGYQGDGVVFGLKFLNLLE
ncbi:MAG: hypothetical protein EBS55_06395 [Flavobacteriaceae bacterium]|nr:hypothetical protein [Flavobacteriaceae bacterium]